MLNNLEGDGHDEPLSSSPFGHGHSPPGHCTGIATGLPRHRGAREPRRIPGHLRQAPMRQPLPARGYAKIKLTADQAPGPQHRTTPPRVARLLADHSANPCRSAVPAPATDASASEANYAVASCLGRRLLTGVVGCHVGTLSRAWARASHPSLRRGRFLRPSCVDEVRAGEVRVGGSAQCALAVRHLTAAPCQAAAGGAGCDCSWCRVQAVASS